MTDWSLGNLKRMLLGRSHWKDDICYLEWERPFFDAKATFYPWQVCLKKHNCPRCYEHELLDLSHLLRAVEVSYIFSLKCPTLGALKNTCQCCMTYIKKKYNIILKLFVTDLIVAYLFLNRCVIGFWCGCRCHYIGSLFRHLSQHL